MINWFRKTYSLAAFLFFVPCLQSVAQYPVAKFEPGYSQGFSIELDVPALEYRLQKTPGGDYLHVRAEGLGYSQQAGAPMLPEYTVLVEMPDMPLLKLAVDTATVVSETLPGRIIPVRVPISKSDDPDKVPYTEDATIYQSDQFYRGGAIAELEEIGRARGVRIGRLTIRPFSYNPVSGVLQQIKSIKVEYTPDQGKAARSKTDKEKYYKHDPVFAHLFDKLANYSDPAPMVKAAPDNPYTRYPQKMVIVADRMYETSLQPFIRWKTRQGIAVVEAYTDMPAVGNTRASITSYLQALYLNGTVSDPAPVYALLVGDVDQIPSYSGTTTNDHPTDLFYFEYTGDYMPELFYGRLSANSVAELDPQIEKILLYQQLGMSDASYLDGSMLVAGEDESYGPSHGNGQVYYAKENYFTAADAYYYPNSSSQASIIQNNMSQGLGFVNYTGHCSPLGWSSPSFEVGDVGSLTNDGKYPLMIGNCCQSNDFSQYNCFGEAMLRAADKGAAGYIGGSDYTYWDEDFYFSVGTGSITATPDYSSTGSGFYDGLFHPGGEDEYLSMGQLIFAGNLSVSSSGSSLDDYYWEIYHLMGDPSATVWLSEPKTPSISHPDALVLGETALLAQAYEGAYVALSSDTGILATAASDASGLASLTFPSISSTDSLWLMVTGQGYAPYLAHIPVVQATGAFLVRSSQSIDDSPGNGNSTADAGESLYLRIDAQNLGADSSFAVAGVLRSSDTLVSILDSTHTYGDIYPDSIALGTTAYFLSVSNAAENGHIASLSIELRDSRDSVWLYPFNLNLAAPELRVAETIYVDDSATANANGRAEGGENLSIGLSVDYAGSTLDSLRLSIESSNPYVTLNSPEMLLTKLASGLRYVEFNATISALAQDGDAFPFRLIAYYGNDSIVSTFYLMCGQYGEDWESGGFNTYNWENQNPLGWSIDSTEVFEGNYALRSGQISHEMSSDLTMNAYVLAEDSISFWYKCSSEFHYDYLNFYVDDVLMMQASGEKNWTYYACMVKEGFHNFRFSYEKDISYTDGQDAAWIDQISLPLMNQAPEIVSTPPVNVAAGALYEYNLTGNDPDGPYQLSYYADNLPAWLSLADLGQGQGTLSGTPAYADAGRYEIALFLSDEDSSMAAEQSYTLEVSPTEGWPVYVYHSIDDAAANNNGIAEYGEGLLLNLSIENLGVADLTGLQVELNSPDSLVQITDSTENLGTITGGDTADYSGIFELQIDTVIEDGHLLNFSLDYKDANDSSWTDSFSFPVSAPAIRLDYWYAEDGWRGNKRPENGEEIELVFHISNTGSAGSDSLLATVSGCDEGVSVYIDTAFADSFEKQAYLRFPISIDSVYPFRFLDTFRLTIEIPNTRLDTSLLIIINPVVADFENGLPGCCAFVDEGASYWGEDSIDVYEGGYSQRSGAISNEEESSISISLHSTSAGEIGFYRKVSSEYGYDYLNFYIDDQLQASWSGEKDWGHVRFPVSSGKHTYRWSYEKDYSVSEGSDAAWIDSVSLPGYNHCPVFEHISQDAAQSGSLYINPVRWADADEADTATLSLTGLPAWCTITDTGPDSLLFEGTPDASYEGVPDTIYLSLSDGNNALSTDTVLYFWVAGSDPVLKLKEVIYDDTLGTVNGEADYKDTAYLHFIIENQSNTDAYVVSGLLSTTHSDISVLNGSFSTPSIPALSTDTIRRACAIAVNPDCMDGTTAVFELNLQDNNVFAHTYTFGLELHAPDLSLGYVLVNDTASGNGDGRLDPGDTATLMIELWNQGSIYSPQASVSILSPTPGVSIPDPLLTIDSVPPGYLFAQARVAIDESYDTRLLAEIEFRIDAEVFQDTVIKTFRVGAGYEGWENGDSTQHWVFRGDSSWFITGRLAYEGDSCLQSGPIRHGDSTSLSLGLFLNAADSISFYMRKSTEYQKDLLLFYVNDSLWGQWSGQREWQRKAFQLDTGRNELSWTYRKNYAKSAGEDAVWLDAISLPAAESTPWFESQPDIQATEDQAYNYSIASTSDTGSAGLLIELTTAPYWLTFSDLGDGAAELGGIPTNEQVGDTVVVLRTYQPTNTINYAEQSYVLTIANTNDAPYYTSTPPDTAIEDQAFTYVVGANDDDAGASLQFALNYGPAWLSLTDNGDGTAILTGVPDAQNAGDTLVSISLSDGIISASVDQDFALYVKTQNDAPQVITGPVDSALINQPYTGTLTATDEESDAIFIEAVELPAWLSLTDNGNGTASLEGTPAGGDAGSVTVKTRLHDMKDTVIYNYTLHVKVVNSSPVYLGSTNLTAWEDSTFSYMAIFSDADDDPLGISIISKATWLSVNTSGDTAYLSGTPANSDVGISQLRLSVDDDVNPPSITSINIQVINTPDPPVFTSTPDSIVYADSLYLYSITASDADGDKISISATEKPDWASLSPVSNGFAQLGGTPGLDDLGPHRVVIEATDSISTPASQSFRIMVITEDMQPLMSNQRFSIDENSPAGTVVDTLIAFDYNPDDHLTYTIEAGNNDNAFALGLTSGILTVNNQAALDYEKVQSYQLLVRVSDDSPKRLYTEALISIYINDLYDVGLTEDDANDGLMVYPQPARDILHIAHIKQGGPGRCNLYNSEGKLLYGKVFEDNKTWTIDVSSLASGEYYLEVFGNNRKTTRLIIIY